MTWLRSTAMLAGLIAAAAALAPIGALADDRKLDADFARRMFAGSVPNPKAYACFARHYDARAHGGTSVAEGRRDEAPDQHGEGSGLAKFPICIPARRQFSRPTRQFQFERQLRPCADDQGSGQFRYPARGSRDAGPPASISNATSIATAAASMSRSPTATIRSSSSSIISASGRGNAPDAEAAGALQAGADDKVFRLDRTGLERMRFAGRRPQGIGGDAPKALKAIQARDGEPDAPTQSASARRSHHADGGFRSAGPRRNAGRRQGGLSSGRSRQGRFRARQYPQPF